MIAQEVAVIHEIDLGQHTLFIYADGSIDLLANDEQSYHADNLMSLDENETYRLFVSLRELYQ